MKERKIVELEKEKERIIKRLPPMDKIMRGTFIEYYLECIRKKCKCHKGDKYRHGPYYRVSYGKEGKMYHVYVPVKMKEEVKSWIENYNKLWEAIEKITEINAKIIRLKNGRKK